MVDSSEEGGQSDIATQEAKKISKSPFHLGGKSTARLNNGVTTCELKMTEPSWCFECFFLSLSCWEFTRYSLENALEVSLACSVLVSSSCRHRGIKGHCELLALFYKALLELLFFLEMICKPPKRFSFVLANKFFSVLKTSLIKRAKYPIKISDLGVRSDFSPNDK